MAQGNKYTMRLHDVEVQILEISLETKTGKLMHRVYIQEYGMTVDAIEIDKINSPLPINAEIGMRVLVDIEIQVESPIAFGYKLSQ